MLAVPSYRKFDSLGHQARQDRRKRFGSLLHYLDIDLLKSAYVWLEQEAAADVDRRTWVQYGRDLQTNLVDLHGRLQRGVYRAQPRRRRWLPPIRPGRRGRRRALLEDSLVQRAVAELLDAIYEQDFLSFSYGFRRGRGRHAALVALAKTADSTQLRWIVYVDMAGFFESASHRWLLRCVEYRIGDPRLIRLLCRWLQTGLMEGDALKPAAKDRPCDILAPLLANVYLHYVFDLWAARWRQRHGRGTVLLIRHGQDIVVGFEREVEAKRFIEELRQRLSDFAPTLPPAKARLVEFDRKAWEQQTRGFGNAMEWRELQDVPSFRKGLALLQKDAPFRVHSPQHVFIERLRAVTAWFRAMLPLSRLSSTNTFEQRDCPAAKQTNPEPR